MEVINIASIDIGKTNFAFYIEEVNLTNLRNISNIPLESRYNENGTLTETMEKLLKEVHKTGKTILYKNENLTIDTDKSKYLDKNIFYNMIDHLDKYKSYFEKCDYILIEMQLKRNTMAMKLGQHCYSYFAIRYGRGKQIIEFPAYYKTQILGAEKIFDKKYKNGKIKWKTMDQRSRKKWAVKKALEILEDRGEVDIASEIKSVKRGKKKLDDICDNKLMIEAFKYMYFVDNIKFDT
jgi:hypothetical protein